MEATMDEVQLNTLYVVTEGAYLHLDGQTIAIEVNKALVTRIPLHMIDSIACFGRVMISPQLMEAAAEAQIAINFLTANGRLMARVERPGSAGVQLRRRQFRRADDAAFRLEVSRAIVAGKVQNSRQNLLRSARDGDDGANADALRRAAALLMHNVESAARATSLDELRGIEGDAARLYFEHFALMTPGATASLCFIKRTRQPPLDPINALLSLFYSILTHDCTAALVAAGLDPAVGFFHEERPGRPSLALDLVEEFRAYLADRFVITLINRKQVGCDDFVTRPGGAVELSESARRRIIAAFQERKQERRKHPYLEQESTIGRFPALQAKILARHVRGDLQHYVPLVIK
ncbi:MAG TPA: type I-C CRISPR-associated endonuclease Cas1c [Tepidisphaeraceae bacterium]